MKKKKEFVVVIEKTVPAVEILCGLSNDVRIFSSRREAVEFMRGFNDVYRIETKEAGKKEMRKRFGEEFYKMAELREVLNSISK